MVGYSFLDDSFIRNSMPVYPGANQPCRLLQCKRDVTASCLAILSLRCLEQAEGIGIRAADL
jgi:hypothetical protein